MKKRRLRERRRAAEARALEAIFHKDVHQQGKVYRGNVNDEIDEVS